MAKIISLFNHKGGVGKTTLVHNLGAMLKRQGKKVLLIDTDPQMNLTTSVLGFSDSTDYDGTLDTKWQKAREEHTNISNVLNDLIEGNSSNLKLFHSPKNNDLFGHKPNEGELDLLCGDIGIFKIETYVFGQISQIGDIRNPFIGNIELKIREIGSKYDYVLIDTSPSANSILTGIFVTMSDYFLVPVLPNFFSLQAINNLGDIFTNWLKLLSPYEKTANYPRGLSLNSKFAGIVANGTKRFRKSTGTKITGYASSWSGKLNSKVEVFFKQMLNRSYLTSFEICDIL